MSHLSDENRKTICVMLSHKAKCKEIAEMIGCDPTTIAKEIKKNRIVSKECVGNKVLLCKRLERFPFVCLDCSHKYKDCTLTQFRYDPVLAYKKYETRLRNSRKGINLTKEEYEELVASIRNGLRNKQSIYSIVKSLSFSISVPTVYRYIGLKKIEVSKMELPYALTYKKRKVSNKKYEYPDNNKINRSNRTFIDYLAYMKSHINELGSQMDFLGSIRTDKKSLLVLIIPGIHFPLLKLIEHKTSEKVVRYFDELEELIGLDKFKEVFPTILTDRDPCFADMIGIEFSKINGARRTLIFYCDAFKSTQKASVENMNKQLRKFFPKGKSIDHLSDEDVKRINLLIVSAPLYSLDGKSPKEAFILLYGIDAFNKLFD
jgi:IS30 family transposase